MCWLAFYYRFLAVKFLAGCFCNHYMALLYRKNAKRLCALDAYDLSLLIGIFQFCIFCIGALLKMSCILHTVAKDLHEKEIYL